MTSLIRANFIRFLLVIGVQIVLKEVDYKHIDIYIYPMFILMLPLGIVNGFLIFLGFITGFCIDVFYNTMGLHASASVFIAWVRPWWLRKREPRGGYEKGKSLTKHNLGIEWFLKYSMFLIALHTIWVVLLEELTFFSWLWVFRAVIIFILSMLVIILPQYIFNPKE